MSEEQVRELIVKHVPCWTGVGDRSYIHCSACPGWDATKGKAIWHAGMAWPAFAEHLANALLRQPPSAPAKETAPMKEADLMLTTDHYVWAEEFVRRYGGDKELMASWFASAMCAARDKLTGPPNGDAMQYMLDREKPTEAPATPVVQPEAQVMESVRKLPGVTDDGTWIQCPTSEVASLVTRECNAARLAALEEAAQRADYQQRFANMVAGHCNCCKVIADRIRALAATKEQSR